MLGLTYDDIVRHIVQQKSLSIDDIEKKVKEKLNKLSGLISKEGAAHIIANELGINLMETLRREGVKIDRLTGNMRGVTVIGKVLRVYDVRTFVKNNREGKVGTFLIGDSTGVIRVVLWDTNHIQSLEQQLIREDVIVKLQDVMIRENQGFKEAHLNQQSSIVLNPPNITIDVVQQPAMQQPETVKKMINQLQPGDQRVSITGTIVQVFEPRFYDSCPQCNKKVLNGTCTDHGNVISKSVPILNFYFDDGTSNIRAVAFREQVLQIVGIDDGTLQQFRNEPFLFEPHKQQLLGKQYELIGRVTQNEMFGRIEFTVQQLQEADAEKIVSELTQSSP